MTIFDSIQKPTLLIAEQRVRANIQRMAVKAASQNIRFRPHFKTHQSAEIGEWFRPAGVTAITVTSLDMAEYFAAHGWRDMTIAFPVNLRQIEGLNRLADHIHLELLVESPESAAQLEQKLSLALDVWIKIDSGGGRTGIPWDQSRPLLELARAIQASRKLNLKGLLTHAGHTYTGGSPESIRAVYSESVTRMNHARQTLSESGFTGIQLSVGDTPGCTLSRDLGAVDEIRPGNFVFYDAEQLTWGVCAEEDVAAALACPVVAVHPQREEAVLYGGAIHLSKDFFLEDGRAVHGRVCLPEGDIWGSPLPGAYVARLSQEHGVAHIPAHHLQRIRVGDLLCIIPAHVCLTVQVMRGCMTLEGRPLPVI